MSGALRTPLPLAPGARVRVVAPSWAVDADRLEAGLSVLAALGLEPVLGGNVGLRAGFFAGDDAARLAALEEALDDPSSPVLWVAQGGHGATRLVGRLDPRRIRAAGKWLVGFSDATALHAAWQRAGLASLYGPNVTTLAAASEGTRAALAASLFEGRLPAFAVDAPPPGSTVRAPVVGGTLSVWTALVGTGLLPPARGRLLFFEDVDEATHRLDRFVVQLLGSGALEGAAGALLGGFERCPPSHGDGACAEAVIAAALADRGIASAGGVPVGHGRSSRPLLLGGAYAWTEDARLVPDQPAA